MNTHLFLREARVAEHADLVGYVRPRSSGLKPLQVPPEPRSHRHNSVRHRL